MNRCNHRLAILAGMIAVYGTQDPALYGQAKDVPTPPSKAQEPKSTSAKPTQPAGDRARYLSAKKDLLAHWANVRALTLHLATEGEFLRADVLERTEGGGTYDYLLKEGVAYMRAERLTKPVSVPGQTHVIGPSNWALMVSDGTSVYTHQKRGSQEHVFKDSMEFNRLPHMGAEQFFTELESADTYQRLQDEKQGTHDCYVFQASPESGNPVVTYHLDKGIGVMLRFHIDDRLNNRFNTLAVEGLAINPTFGADHFQFKMPEGVGFTDRTSKAKPPNPKVKPSEAKKAVDATPAENKPD